MSKMSLVKPTLLMLYGYPGAGKSYMARQLTEELGAVHVDSDRIRFTLFDQPTFSKRENEIVSGIMDYMTEEFLRAGVSVIYDTNASRTAQRRELRSLANKSKATSVLVWLQIDIESAFFRVAKRDRRRADDKYAQTMDRSGFDQALGAMQNPSHNEEYVVVSGKHTFNAQRGAIAKKLYELGLISPDQANTRVVKPGLVNLVPNPLGGRVDPTRRNIMIR